MSPKLSSAAIVFGDLRINKTHDKNGVDKANAKLERKYLHSSGKLGDKRSKYNTQHHELQLPNCNVYV